MRYCKCFHLLLRHIQHLCNLIEVNPVYHIQGRRVVMVLMGSHRWNPRMKEYSVENRVNLPRVGKFKLIEDGSDFTDNREGTDHNAGLQTSLSGSE
jgi:hypothetical protein